MSENPYSATEHAGSTREPLLSESDQRIGWRRLLRFVGLALASQLAVGLLLGFVGWRWMRITTNAGFADLFLKLASEGLALLTMTAVFWFFASRLGSKRILQLTLLATCVSALGLTVFLVAKAANPEIDVTLNTWAIAKPFLCAAIAGLLGGYFRHRDA